jgi:low temperature requirement protein LtrA
LRDDGDGTQHRRVGWLELFFDLVFVVVIAQMAHHLSENLSARGILEFIFTFIAVWWVWIGGMYYAERFETQDFSFRLFTFLQMLPVAGMALTVAYAFEGRWAGFALSYVLARCIIVFLWWRAGRHEPRFAPTALRFNLGFVTSIVLWSSSIFVPLEVGVVLAAIGLVFDLVAPWTTIAQQQQLPRLSSSHLPERFGLFVMITLGEAIIGTINGVASTKSFEFSVLGLGALGMLLVFATWWMYYDFIGRRFPRPFISATLPWSYLHLPLVMGIAGSSAAVLQAIGSKTGLEDNARLVLCGALAIKLLSLGLLEYTLYRDPSEPTHLHLSPGLKFAAAAVALLLIPLSVGWSALGLMLATLALMLVQIVYGVWVWFHHYPNAPEAALELQDSQV